MSLYETILSEKWFFELTLFRFDITWNRLTLNRITK